MSATLSPASIARAYDRWAPLYDFVFGSLFRHGRPAAMAAAERVGGRVLEIGDGNGISLLQYERGGQVVSIDRSEQVLDEARERLCGFEPGERIGVVDAERLAYPDSSFDAVVAQYVISAVPRPERVLGEFARVCRPGGEIIVTTRVSADGGMRGAIEKGLIPIASPPGCCTDFPFGLYRDWANRRVDVALIEQRELPPLGHFSLIRFAKLAKAGAATGPLAACLEDESSF